MKILMTTDLYTPQVNGVVTSIRTLKEGLENLGHQVRILTLAADSQIDVDQHIYSVSSINLGKVYPGARFSLTTNALIYQEILDWQPDIIHSHCEFSTFKMAKDLAEDLNIPLVHTYHTVYEDYTHYFSPNKKVGKKMVSLISHHLLKQVDLVIAPTQKVKDLLESYEVDQPIEVVPTGINTQQFNQVLNQDDRRAMRAAFGVSDSDVLLLFVGRLAKEKNIEEIIGYLHRLNHPNIKFLICGDGPNRQALENLVRDLAMEEVVQFTGMINPTDIASYYQLGDIFVSASTSETQGLTYLEALLGGLPLLCREDECLNQVIYKGVNGYTYRDFADFEKYLTTMTAKPQSLKVMGRVGSELARSRYSAESFASKMAWLYQGLSKKACQCDLCRKSRSRAFLSNLKSWVYLWQPKAHANSLIYWIF